MLPLIRALLQAAPASTSELSRLLQLVLGSSLENKAVLLVLFGFSIATWWIIFWKWKVFRRVHRQGSEYSERMKRAQRLEEAHNVIFSLPDSPYGRVFLQGVNFFTELSPTWRREIGPGLSLTQLEALRLVLEKTETEERDELQRGLTWLAVIATVSPLLGLLGTVIGVMNVFLGIAETGASNMQAVAPGVGEALIATVGGLTVAIPAAMFYNYYVGRLNLVASELEGFSSEFIGTLAREGRI
jgi:biopolymer transport protein TolQ